jgi:hypothetical protein
MELVANEAKSICSSNKMKLKRVTVSRLRSEMSMAQA